MSSDNPPPLPGTPGKVGKVLIVVLALAAAVAGYYLQLKPEFEKSMAQARRAQRRILVESNLRYIGSKADAYFAEHPDAREVSVRDLKRSYPRELTLMSMAGESYDNLVVSRNWRTLSVALPNGESVSWFKP